MFKASTDTCEYSVERQCSELEDEVNEQNLLVAKWRDRQRSVNRGQ
jgi:hypothetical protein